jgi:hypothetical protein
MAAAPEPRRMYPRASVRSIPVSSVACSFNEADRAIAGIAPGSERDHCDIEFAEWQV